METTLEVKKAPSYTVHHSTRVLQAKNSHNRLKYWEGEVISDDEGVIYTRTQSWQRLGSGKNSSTLCSTPKRIEGKNLGKANETTPLQQAISEIESQKSKKMDKGYWPEGNPEPHRLPLPMLAHSYQKRGKDIVFPAYTQPKLDGTRMSFDGKQGWSRSNKLYIPEVIEHLKVKLPDGMILDGELMLPHESYTFQETIRAIKKFRKDVSPQLKFFVYDIINTKQPFIERIADLVNTVRALNHPNIILVDTHIVQSEEQLQAKHLDYVQAGYEGLMVRNAQGLYKLKDRSVDLQKLKNFDEAEFIINNFTEGSGKDEGTVLFVCDAFENGEFTVRPKGTHAQRKAWFDEGEDLIGKELTVRYQGLSEDGIPRFPVGIAIRDRDLQG